MRLLIRDKAEFTKHKTIMSLEVVWKLMFRVNDREGADHCVANALGKLSASVTDGPKPYWKQPELWEISLRNNFGSPNSEGVLSLLAMANTLATGWYIWGPLTAYGQMSVFDGVFDCKSGREHVAGLRWASFSVGEFSVIDVESPTVAVS